MLAFWAQLDAKKAAAKLGTPVQMADIPAQRKSAERGPVTLENNSSTTYDASPPRPVDLPMTTEDPFQGRRHGNLVFLRNCDRCFYIGLRPWEQKKWLRDYPKLWFEDALRDLQARAGADVAAEPTVPRSTPSATEVPTGGESDGRFLVPGDDKCQPDRPGTNTAPPTIADAEATAPATAAAGDEINIGGRRFVSEPRVAAMLGCSPRTLQRWRKDGKGPPSTKIGRKTFYELNELQKWMDRERSR